MLSCFFALAQDTLNADSNFFRRRKIRELVFVRKYNGIDSFVYRFDQRGKLREYLYVSESTSRTIRKYAAYNDTGELTEQRIIDSSENDTDFFAGTYRNGEWIESHVWNERSRLCTEYRHVSDTDHYIVTRSLGDPYFQYWEYLLDGCYDQTTIRSDTTGNVHGDNEQRTIVNTELTPKKQFLSQTTIFTNKGVEQLQVFGEPVQKEWAFRRRTYERYDESRLEEKYWKSAAERSLLSTEKMDFKFNRYDVPKPQHGLLLRQPGLRIRHAHDQLPALRPVCSYERFAFMGNEP
jgi:hypothetical protein